MNDSILFISNENKTYLGTCFVIDNDEEGSFFATCGHVLNNCKETLYIENEKFEVIIDKSNEGLDLAILYVKGLHKEPISILKDALPEKCKVTGFTKLINNPKKETIFNIAIKSDIELNTTSKVNLIKLYSTESISAGYSGSPVLCSNTNQVIGIVIIKEGENINYAINSKHLLEIYTLKSKKITFTENKYIGLNSNISSDSFAKIKEKFNSNFEKSLETFFGQPKIWIKPRIHSKEEDINTLSDEDTKVDLENIINNPKSLIIKAREQYGLSTLSHYLVKEAWNKSRNSLWLRVDVNELKPHSQEINKVINNKLHDLGLVREDIECIILDEFSSSMKDANKILEKINEVFIDKIIIIMYTIIDNPLLNESINLPEIKNYEILHLWALPRSDIRKVVTNYNNEKYLGDENSIVNKVISDLEVLNIPRTALNCLTILKISEIGFDDSPVNRTEMLGRILSLLFNIEEIPIYKLKPDLKDTEYTLGYFCELLLKDNNYFFSRKYFLDKLNTFCKDMVIDLDIDVIFDILYKNNIIVLRGELFCFKFSYWIFYFAAQRMHKNKPFAEYILNNMNYTSYPELIEFYTGIDRSRDDALEIMIGDIKNIRATVDKKCGLQDLINIFNLAQWNPSPERIEEMHAEMAEGVLESNLPDVIKDEYADKSYDRTRPLNQNIYKILEEYSLLRLMRSIQACSKALRNSDYSSPKIKFELLSEILNGWKQITTVLIALSPILSEKGHVSIEGASFILNGDFGKTPEERFNQIISLLPINIVGWFKDDLFTKRMGTLLFSHLEKEDNKFIKHVLNLLLINKRPKGWDKCIEDYIFTENKNSFYLADIYGVLIAEYKYSFATEGTLRIIEKLIKMAILKHELGIKKPTPSSIKSFEKKGKIFIPTRDEEIE